MFCRFLIKTEKHENNVFPALLKILISVSCIWAKEKKQKLLLIK